MVLEGRIYPCSFEESLWSESSLPYLPSSSWSKVKTLGEACYGKVYLAKGLAEGSPQLFALKVMPKPRVMAGVNSLESARNELCSGEVLRALRPPCVVEVFFAAQDEDNFYLATEYCKEGELFVFVQERHKQFQGEEAIRGVMKQLLTAVSALHEAGIAHRDISLENLLIQENSVRLIDFGQALLVHRPGKSENEACVQPSLFGPPGKPNYLAPEAHVPGYFKQRRHLRELQAQLHRLEQKSMSAERQQERLISVRGLETIQEESCLQLQMHSLRTKVEFAAAEFKDLVHAQQPYQAKKLDVFACGVLLYVLAFGSYPFDPEAAEHFEAGGSGLFCPEVQQQPRCVRLRGALAAKKLQADASEGMIDLLEQLLTPMPGQRPSALEALLHPWLSDRTK